MEEMEDGEDDETPPPSATGKGPAGTTGFDQSYTTSLLQAGSEARLVLPTNYYFYIHSNPIYLGPFIWLFEPSLAKFWPVFAKFWPSFDQISASKVLAFTSKWDLQRTIDSEKLSFIFQSIKKLYSTSWVW